LQTLAGIKGAYNTSKGKEGRGKDGEGREWEEERDEREKGEGKRREQGIDIAWPDL